MLPIGSTEGCKAKEMHYLDEKTVAPGPRPSSIILSPLVQLQVNFLSYLVSCFQMHGREDRLVRLGSRMPSRSDSSTYQQCRKIIEHHQYLYLQIRNGIDNC